jgi:hypothetical protein
VLKAEKDLLNSKVQQIFEDDTSSFNMKLYSQDEEFHFGSPTKTMALVLSFIENNNKLLEQIAELKLKVDASTECKESSDTEGSLRFELLQSQLRNQKLIDALIEANEHSDLNDEELRILREESSLIKNKLTSLTRENQILKFQHNSKGLSQ